MALLEFYGKECPHCVRMAPMVEKLKGEGHNIEQYEVWHDQKNAAKMEEFDRGLCGGVPFFYNSQSHRFICGGTDEKGLRAWVAGKGGELVK